MKDFDKSKDVLTPEERAQKNYYNRIAQQYETHYNDYGALLYREYIFQNCLNNVNFKGKLVLDAMCGGGQSTKFFLDRGARVVGVDISDNQILEYKRKFPHCEVYNQSILDFDTYLGDYDFIITDSLHHMHPNVESCMIKFYNLLKADGVLMVWEPSAGSIVDVGRKLWYKYDKKFFESNESSISLQRLEYNEKLRFKMSNYYYGGGLGYVFLLITMALRIPKKIKNIYLIKALIKLELFLNKFQTKYTAFWFIALFNKKELKK